MKYFIATAIVSLFTAHAASAAYQFCSLKQHCRTVTVEIKKGVKNISIPDCGNMTSTYKKDGIRDIYTYSGSFTPYCYTFRCERKPRTINHVMKCVGSTCVIKNSSEKIVAKVWYNSENKPVVTIMRPDYEKNYHIGYQLSGETNPIAPEDSMYIAMGNDKFAFLHVK